MTPARFLEIRDQVRAQARLDHALSGRLEPMTAVAMELVEELERWALAREREAAKMSTKEGA